MRQLVQIKVVLHLRGVQLVEAFYLVGNALLLISKLLSKLLVPILRDLTGQLVLVGIIEHTFQFLTSCFKLHQ
ncbi:hypothetical protein COY17_01405 [Candidatus Saccharibacteria bacterium CG_4_10_14_0_2_um_filter_52_9]|nr:MAG: hypothetical protein COY17_01405 [Candidatus Saccharibacteria bacterium CG_4_10_14_0_2_um_filter_52_9]